MIKTVEPILFRNWKLKEKEGEEIVNIYGHIFFINHWMETDTHGVIYATTYEPVISHVAFDDIRAVFSSAGYKLSTITSLKKGLEFCFTNYELFP